MDRERVNRATESGPVIKISPQLTYDHTTCDTIRDGVVTASLSSLGSPRAGRDAVTTPDRKSTRLNSSHQIISYAVFCLKKKKPNLKCPLPSYRNVQTIDACPPTSGGDRRPATPRHSRTSGESMKAHRRVSPV